MDKPDDTTEIFLRACAEGSIEVVQSLIAEHIFHRAPSQNSGSGSDGVAVGIRNTFENAAEQEGGSHYFIAEGWSALHCAVYNGQKDVVKIILDHLRCRDTFVSGVELQPVAIARRLLACVSTCLGGGVGTRWAKNSLEDDAYRKALFVNARGAVPPPATRIGQPQARHNNNNINPHCVSITALHMAVCLHGELLTQAVDAGDVRATEQRARSLRSIVRLLLNVEADEEKGVDVTCKDTCKCGDVRETKTGSGGDVTAQPDNNVYTTRSATARSKRTLTSANGIGPQRMRKGPIADVNIPSTDHDTPLHTAASMCDIQMLELLLSPSLVPPASAGKSSTLTPGEGVRRSTDDGVAAEETNQTCTTRGGILCAFRSNVEGDYERTGTRSTSLDIDLGDTASTLDSIALSFGPLMKYLVGTLVILLLAYFGESKNGDDDDTSNTKDVVAAVRGGGGEGSAQEGGLSWISETTMWMYTSFLVGLIVLFWVLDSFIFSTRTRSRKRTPLKRCLTFIAENCGLRKYPNDLSSFSSRTQTHLPRPNLDREAHSGDDDTLYRTRGYPSARLLVSKGAKTEKVFSFWVSSGQDRCPLKDVFFTDFLDYYAFGAYPYVVDELAVTAAEDENTTTGTFFESPHYLLRSHVSITSSPSHICAQQQMRARRSQLIAVDLITLFLAAGGTSVRLDESAKKSTGATGEPETFFAAKFLIEVVKDGILHLRNVSALLQTLIDHGLDCDAVYTFRIEIEENDANNNNNNNNTATSKPTKFVYDTLLMILARNETHKLLPSRVGDLDPFIIPQKALPRPSVRDLGLEDPSSLIPLREQSFHEVAVSIYKDVVRVVMANMSDAARRHVDNSSSLKPHLKKGIYPSPPPSSVAIDEEKGPVGKVKSFFSSFLVRGEYDDGCTALDVAISEGNTAFVEAFCSVARISKESQKKLWEETKR